MPLITEDEEKREEKIYFPRQKSYNYLSKLLHGSVIDIIHRHLVTMPLYDHTCIIYVYKHISI